MDVMRWPGTVYILKCEGYMKIGFTTDNPESRRKAIQTANPFLVELIRTFSNCTRVHQEQLHRIFAKLSVRDEWFEYSPLILKINPTKPRPLKL